MISKFLTGLFLVLFGLPLFAEEGLWIPALLERYAINDMHDKGLKLSAEDIYSINQSCLKDAVVIFGTGCTGEIISQEGLVLTNHHCGFRYIQSHSSIENNYLSNGYWAMSREEEIVTPDLSVTFLIRIENVSAEILKGTESAITEKQRHSITKENIERLKEESVKNTIYKSVIKPFYYGNEYYMFIYLEYTDVRLVGTPPESIGNFGSDTDNWMWPRHTGDFCLFRIYADENNNPAGYSPTNIPYRPNKSMSISLNGYNENDFTMVIGYPGTTTEYLISDGVKLSSEIIYPAKIKLREKRMDIVTKYMNQDENIKIQYASKYRDISNIWKKLQGSVRGLEKYNAVSQKSLIEEKFKIWVENDSSRQEKYGEVLPELKDFYRQLSFYALANEYTSENVLATEILNFASKISSFFNDNNEKTDNEKIATRDVLIKDINKFFKDYNASVDLEVLQTMLNDFNKDIDSLFHPEIFKYVNKKYRGDFNHYAKNAMNKTILTSQDRLMELFKFYPENENHVIEILKNDPIYQLLNSYSMIYNNEVIGRYNFLIAEINALNRKYIEGLREMDSSLVLYPDANFTMRVSYGKVEGYQPSDAIEYQYYTTLEGVIEKTVLSDAHYIPVKLYQLYLKKDYGPWKMSDGSLPVCFAASNHTSGGNSGSPVLDKNGRLIGINFDRNWEGTMSDIFYDVSICRNICVDIRYILFIIDKYADAGYLIDEMDLIWE